MLDPSFPAHTRYFETVADTGGVGVVGCLESETRAQNKPQGRMMSLAVIVYVRSAALLYANDGCSLESLRPW